MTTAVTVQLSNATEIEEDGESSTHDAAAEDFFDFSNNDTERTQKHSQYLNDKDKQLATLNRHTEIKQLFLRYNSTLPSSKPVERLFSAGALILTKNEIVYPIVYFKCYCF